MKSNLRCNWTTQGIANHCKSNGEIEWIYIAYYNLTILIAYNCLVYIYAYMHIELCKVILSKLQTLFLLSIIGKCHMLR